LIFLKEINLHGEKENIKENFPNLAIIELTFSILNNYAMDKC
jgi:hypothetical protein